MDYEIIEDEIFEFIDNFFDEFYTLAEDNENFIENNNLHIPKENYMLLNKFLQKTLSNFKNVDHTFCSSTLNKLSIDLNYLSVKLENLIKNSKDIKTIFEKQFVPIFEKQFVPISPTLVDFAKVIVEFTELPNKTIEEFAYFKQMKKNYLKLKEIYYDIFEEAFNNERKYNIMALKYGINTKAYYFDKLLWKEANSSKAIVRYFKIRKLNGKLNSKKYILFITALMLPYVDEYRYLQRCLRIFK